MLDTSHQYRRIKHSVSTRAQFYFLTMEMHGNKPSPYEDTDVRSLSVDFHIIVTEVKLEHCKEVKLEHCKSKII
jgi:hypothetical protein